jgi:hypothetical protein
MDTQAKEVVPQHPHPLERNPSGNLRREEVPRMSTPYGSNWINSGKAARQEIWKHTSVTAPTRYKNINNNNNKTTTVWRVSYLCVEHRGVC